MTTMPHSPDSENDDLSPLLSEPFASAWDAPVAPGPLGERLGARLQRSLDAERGMVTVRRRSHTPEALGDGAQGRWLYRAPAGRPLRPGEPRAALVIELQAGAEVALPAGGVREFLVMRGDAQLHAADGVDTLGLRDFLLLPAGHAVRLASQDGAHVFVREADGDAPARTLVRDVEAGWPEFAPGIRRRVLWTAAGQASLLYRADPGASVPVHSHGHDEECLMVQGELFLDDLLLQQGDYQLAPAGTGHRITETDTGVILYAHGDLDLQFT
ncbi:MAG: cupin domain-containing protein [Pelomonas sp.]|nr:cupin domain-containing protein [Roseateles sp.]